MLEREARDGVGLGFTGKQCIHPNQVETVQSVFSPSVEEVRGACRVLVAEEVARGEGRGSWGLDGKMVDAPVVGKARRVVEKARLAGVDVEKLRREVGDVRPE